MRRTAIVVFAVVMAVLVSTATPATAASSSLAVGSQHTDFGTGNENSPQTLENMSVSGSGDSASVRFSASRSLSYNPVNDDGDGTTDQSHYFLGDTAGDDPIDSELRLEPSQSFTLQELTVDIAATQGSDYGFTVDVYIVEEAPDQTYGEGTKVKSGYDPTFATGEQTIRLDTDYDLEAGKTYTVELVTSGTDSDGATDGLKIKADDSASTTWFSNSFGTTHEQYPDITAAGTTSGGDTGKYLSATHSVDNAEQAAVNITSLENASATIRVEKAATGTAVASKSVTSAANHTLSFAKTSDDLQVNITVTNQSTNGAPSFELSDESILFEADAPIVDNSSASPSGDERVNSSSVTLSIDVSDGDFGTSQGDDLTATWYLDGSQEAVSSGITSNGTVSTDVEISSGGSHTWRVELTDEYGNSVSSETFSFQSPSTLRIYEEENSTSLIDNRTVNATLYFQGDSGLIVERNVTNGTLDLSGLPVDEGVVIVADADGYIPRRIYLRSVIDQGNIYLLKESKKHVQVRFDIQDFSGKFDSEDTVLQVQRALNGTWRTVEGDYFGASGEFPTNLRYNTRHRLVLINTETGDRKVAGTYTPLASTTTTVKILSDETVEIVRPEPIMSVSPNIGSIPASVIDLEVALDDQETDLDWWNVTIMHRNSSGNTTLRTFNNSNSGGTVTPTLNLTTFDGGNVTVITRWRTAGGEIGSSVEVYRLRTAYQNQFALLAVLTSIDGHLAPGTANEFTTLVGAFVTIFVTAAASAAFPMSTEQSGLIGLLILSGFSLIGWVGYSLVFAAGVAMIAIGGLRRQL